MALQWHIAFGIWQWVACSEVHFCEVRVKMSLQYDLFAAEQLKCSEAIFIALSLAIYSRPSEKWHKVYGSKYILVFY